MLIDKLVILTLDRTAERHDYARGYWTGIGVPEEEIEFRVGIDNIDFGTTRELIEYFADHWDFQFLLKWLENGVQNRETIAGIAQLMSYLEVFFESIKTGQTFFIVHDDRGFYQETEYSEIQDTVNLLPDSFLLASFCQDSWEKPENYERLLRQYPYKNTPRYFNEKTMEGLMTPGDHFVVTPRGSGNLFGFIATHFPTCENTFLEAFTGVHMNSFQSEGFYSFHKDWKHLTHHGGFYSNIHDRRKNMGGTIKDTHQLVYRPVEETRD